MHDQRPALRFTIGVLVSLALGAARGEAAGPDPVGALTLPPGFRAELVYAVPRDQQGSWVCLAVDERGRLIASDQSGGLYRIEPSGVGQSPAGTKVEAVPMSIGMAQGLLVHRGQLYVVVNGMVGSFGSGLYRLSDSNGDDQYDRLEQLRVFQGAGEHGPHAVVLGPDGQSLYIVCGNMTGLPAADGSLVPLRWGEDQLLPRIFDPMGQANAILAPGGWVARTDLEGKNLELFSVGFRNAYDLAFNDDRELFTFDSDMEWDIGTPWYRPTRVCHVTSGSDWGWRSGNGPWPQYFPDTLPTVVDVGPGSPTGLAFGAGTKFPPRYQRALFAGDWSYGNIYAVHLAADGASYRGQVERFASAMPLGVTDMVVCPQDGALYFTVGGRSSQSALYRIVWAGDAAEGPGGGNAAVRSAEDADPTAARVLRRKLETLHAEPQAGAVETAWPYLAHSDRFVRYAARVAVEQQPVAEWRGRIAAEPDARARAQGLVALARCGAPEDRVAWLAAMAEFDFEAAPRDVRLEVLRAAALGVIRFEELDDNSREQLIATFDPAFPTGDYLVDRELAGLLIRAGAPNVIERLLAVLEGAATQEEAIDAAISLTAITAGWTLPERERLLDWFDSAAGIHGGHSSFEYVRDARDRFIANFQPSERDALAERITRPLVQEEAAAAVARPVVRKWTLAELVQLAQQDAGPRDLANGRRMFAAAQCYGCHRVAGEGSAVGPDLTAVGGRYSVPDILRAIVEPNADISDQYRQLVFETGGRVITGRITNLNADTYLVSTDMLSPKKEISIRRDEIDRQYPAETSLMPAGLLDVLTGEEILDLVAYLRSARPENAAASAGSP